MSRARPNQEVATMTDGMMTVHSLLGKESPEDGNITDPGRAPP
jgi:hypothetical protein